MEPGDREKTAFRVAEPIEGQCLFEWRVMPFGLRNAPPTFQRYMTQVMAPCLGFCLVYMDDLLVYSPTQVQHLEDVSRVFLTLRKAQLKVKYSKCVFGALSVEFLGHVIQGGHIAIEPTKKDAVCGWESPLKSAKQVRQFMGLVSYYRNFIPNMSTIAEPLTRLTRKHVRVEWGGEAEQAMRELKGAVLQAQELTVWDGEREIRVTTDASDVGMGAILEQLNDEGEWRIVAS